MISENILNFDIEVLIDQDTSILSSMYKGIQIPDGEVIPGQKDAIISEQVLADYDSFVESIEDLLIDVYNLELTYYDNSENNSNYYNFLAKDKSGIVKIKIRLRLRISNHKAHRSEMSQKHKSEELNSPELIKYTNKRSTIPYAKNVIVNDESYNSYLDAVIDIDEKIQHWVDVMTR